VKNEEGRTKNEELTRAVVAVLLLVAVLGTAQAGTGERIAEKLRAKGLSPEMVVVAVSMLPVVELRGALPIGNNLFHLPLWKTLLLSVVGNMIPIFLVVLLLERVVALLGRIRFFKRFFDWLFKRTRSKSGAIAKYEFWGLAIFVGIPLPGTGAWTGAVAAFAALHIPRRADGSGSGDVALPARNLGRGYRRRGPGGRAGAGDCRHGQASAPGAGVETRGAGRRLRRGP